MQNESELKKIFPKFKKNLNERISEATGTTREFEFLSWWCETAYEGYVTLDYTDASGDGKIDAVVQRPNGEWIVIQAKYNDGYSKTPPDVNRCPREQWEPFDLIAVPAFRNENKFEYYIKSQNIPREKRAIYEKVFHAYQKDSRKVVFEFVTTYDVPKNIEQVLTNIKPQNFCYINDIMSLFNLQQHHQSPPANDLVLTIEQDNVISKQDNDYKINSYLAEVNLKQIIKYMKDNFPDYSIISKNVRTFLKAGNRSINEDIRLTYENRPKEFFYSHNGITILCEEITKESAGTTKTKFTLKQPNVVNGGQTIMSLRDVIDRKINNDGTVLVKIYEISNNDQNAKLIEKIIYRTNQQNAIYWHNLRANDESQYLLAKHFLRRDVYYERRQGEAKLNKSKIKASKLMTVGIQEMAQVLKICLDGPEGIIFAMQKKKKLFENEDTFDEVFSIDEDVAFFQIILFKLIDTICADLDKGPEIKYVKRTIFAIVYDALKDNSYLSRTKFEDYVSLVNTDRQILNYKIDRVKYNLLKTACADLFTICEKEQKIVFGQRKMKKIDVKTAATLKIFISEVGINQTIFDKSRKKTEIRKNTKKHLKRDIILAFDKIFSYHSNPVYPRNS